MDSPTRILVRGVNWLGDAVMTTPALLRLREAQPRAFISLLTPAKLAELWRHHPAVDQILTFLPGEGPLAVARRLRTHSFQTALVLPNSPRSALEPFLARIPERIGHSRPWRNFMLTRAVTARPAERPMHRRSPGEVQRLLAAPPPAPAPLPAEAHHLYQYLHLVQALGARPEPLPPLIAVTAQELAEARRQFGPPPPPEPGRVIGLNVGAEYGPAKRWPLDRFIAVARELQTRQPCHLWIFGGTADVPMAHSLAAALSAPGGTVSRPVLCLAGKTSLRQLCAALQLCDVLLTNDTGPMHLAAAVGTPVVVPFGSTSPEFTAPGLPGDPRHRFLRVPPPCAPCFLRQCPIDSRCLTDISVDAVVQAVVSVLQTPKK